MTRDKCRKREANDELKIDSSKTIVDQTTTNSLCDRQSQSTCFVRCLIFVAALFCVLWSDAMDHSCRWWRRCHHHHWNRRRQTVKALRKHFVFDAFCYGFSSSSSLFVSSYLFGCSTNRTNDWIHKLFTCQMLNTLSCLRSRLKESTAKTLFQKDATLCLAARLFSGAFLCTEDTVDDLFLNCVQCKRNVFFSFYKFNSTNAIQTQRTFIFNWNEARHLPFSQWKAQTFVTNAKHLLAKAKKENWDFILLFIFKSDIKFQFAIF